MLGCGTERLRAQCQHHIANQLGEPARAPVIEAPHQDADDETGGSQLQQQQWRHWQAVQYHGHQQRKGRAGHRHQHQRSKCCRDFYTVDTKEAPDALQQLAVRVLSVVCLGVEAAEHVHCNLRVLMRRQPRSAQKCCGKSPNCAADLRAAPPQRCTLGAAQQSRPPGESARGGA